MQVHPLLQKDKWEEVMKVCCENLP